MTLRASWPIQARRCGARLGVAGAPPARRVQNARCRCCCAPQHDAVLQRCEAAPPAGAADTAATANAVFACNDGSDLLIGVVGLPAPAQERRRRQHQQRDRPRPTTAVDAAPPSHWRQRTSQQQQQLGDARSAENAPSSSPRLVTHRIKAARCWQDVEAVVAAAAAAAPLNELHVSAALAHLAQLATRGGGGSGGGRGCGVQQRPPAELVQRLAAMAVERAPLMRARQVSNTLWALAQLQHQPQHHHNQQQQQDLGTLWERARQLFGSAEPQHLACVAYAAACLRYAPPAPWVADLAAAWRAALLAAASIDDGGVEEASSPPPPPRELAATPQAQVNVLWAMVELRLAPGPEFVQAAADAACATQLARWPARSAAQLAWSLARLGWRPRSAAQRAAFEAALCAACGVQAGASSGGGNDGAASTPLPLLKPQDAANLLWGCAHLGLRPPPELVVRVLRGAGRALPGGGGGGGARVPLRPYGGGAGALPPASSSRNNGGGGADHHHHQQQQARSCAATLLSLAHMLRRRALPSPLLRELSPWLRALSASAAAADAQTACNAAWALARLGLVPRHPLLLLQLLRRAADVGADVTPQGAANAAWAVAFAAHAPPPPLPPGAAWRAGGEARDAAPPSPPLPSGRQGPLDVGAGEPSSAASDGHNDDVDAAAASAAPSAASPTAAPASATSDAWRSSFRGSSEGRAARAALLLLLERAAPQVGARAALRDLAQLLWAAAVLAPRGFRSPALQPALERALAPALGRLEAVLPPVGGNASCASAAAAAHSLSLVAWALAKLRVPLPGRLHAALWRAAAPLLQHMPAEGLGMALHGFSVLRPAASASGSVSDYDGGSTQQHTASALSDAERAAWRAALHSALAAQLRGPPPPPVLATLVWTLGRCRALVLGGSGGGVYGAGPTAAADAHAAALLLAAIEAAADAQLARCSARQLAQVTWGLARLGAAPSPRFVDRLTLTWERRLASAGAADACQVRWALPRLRRYDGGDSSGDDDGAWSTTQPAELAAAHRF